jgi:CBS domain-containing protein
MKAREIMTQPVVTAKQDATLDEIARLMMTHNIGCIPVVDERDQLCGIVTESDFSATEHGIPFSTLRLPQVFSQWMPLEGIERIYEAAKKMRVTEIMNTNVLTLVENDSVERALTLMLKHGMRHLPIVRDGKPVGILTRHDLLKLMARQLKQ